MIANQLLLDALAEHSDSGLICIDRDKKIQLFNQRAKEIIGLVLDQRKSHPGGALKRGDLVVLADNMLGWDDGDCGEHELEQLGIRDREIQPDDILLAMGIYGQSEIKPVYKTVRNHSLVTDLQLQSRFQGHEIQISVSSADKIIRIRIDGALFEMTYMKAIGHLVILDGDDGTLKFYQAKGYTLRKETLGGILRGDSYGPKGPANGEIDVIGVPFSHLFEYDVILEKINSILDMGDRIPIIDEFLDLNKRLTLCSIYPITNADDNGEVEGVLLKIREASELEQLLSDRNKIIEEVERTHANFAQTSREMPKDMMSKLIGSSHVMQEVKYLAYRASKGRSNVILTGESGTGKSLLASEIHRLSGRSGSFVEVNCSSISPNLFESELFGYVGGAFTGALPGGKVGYFELANGGTIFLDEIGEIPPDIQVKLLHVLQNKQFYRVGSGKATYTDVRVISATNKDLEEEVRKGNFRLDLYYRINVFPIHIPPLRQRKTDLYLLINQILKQICSDFGLEPKQLSGTAMKKLLNYGWPGNVRELENVIERAVMICDSATIYPEHLGVAAEENEQTLKSILQETEKKAILDALQQFGGDRQKAQKLLGISRSVFYDKLKKYELHS